jgi:hypothetical protein
MSRALSRRDHGPSETPLTRGLLTPTFVMLSGIVTRCCLNEGFCSVLCRIKSKHSYVLGLYPSTSITSILRSKDNQLRNLRKSKTSASFWRVNRYIHDHHVVRHSRNCAHRHSIWCFASSIGRLPAIYDYRSVSPDELPHVPCVCNGHGFERVSHTRPPAL